LKRRGLAFALSCGNSGGGYEASSNFCLLEINVQLTTAGRERIEEVISLVTHELSMIRNVRYCCKIALKSGRRSRQHA
jgi:secreted Zn-dependent insulinase-like peptidase